MSIKKAIVDAVAHTGFRDMALKAATEAATTLKDKAVDEIGAVLVEEGVEHLREKIGGILHRLFSRHEEETDSEGTGDE